MSPVKKAPRKTPSTKSLIGTSTLPDKPRRSAAQHSPVKAPAKRAAKGKAAASRTGSDPSAKSPVPANQAPAVSAIPKARKRAPEPEPPAVSEPPASAADVVDQQLAKYRSMRNFGVTAEPSGDDDLGAEATAATLPFCIQKHAASHLHYDFRLGWNGVLKSWAVAKGPSYVTADKRLAVQVEDHPIEYGGFEGIIPKGQYGGGTVMLWDEGTWAPQPGHEDVNAGLRDGNLKFILYGTKMHGKWALIRMGGRFAQERKPNWLLIKEHDQYERTPDAEVVTEAEPLSATTSRSMEQIAASEDHVWNSKDTAAKQGLAWFRKEPGTTTKVASPPTATAASQAGVSSSTGQRHGSVATSTPTVGLSDALRGLLSETPKEPQPEFLKPQLAMEAAEPPEGSGWFHELKLDGYRMQARKSARGVEMLTRSGLDWTYRVPSVAEAVNAITGDAITLDGEVVVLREDGTTNFADLQASFQEGARHPLVFFCFDLLHLDGHNTRALSLRDRKRLLTAVLATGDGDQVRVSEHIETGGGELFRRACELHAEGIISKLVAAPYRAGRNGDWLKSKCLHEQEFVVGGFTPPSNGIHGVGALLLGYYDQGRLVYAGRTGTGFTGKTHRLLRDRLNALRVGKTSFARLPAGAGKDAIWVKPEMVVQVRFATWTADDLVRQAAFLGLREDKAARDVRREGVEVAPRPKQLKNYSNGTSSPAADHTTRSDRADVAVTATSDATQVLPRRNTAANLHVVGRDAALTPAQPRSDLSSRPAIRLTHPGKVLDRETSVTKQMLADYYWAVSERMLAGISGRPLSLVRCPEGSEKPCFYQKHVNHLLPAGVTAVDVPDKRTGVTEPYITLSTPEALTGLAQMGVLEIHPWGSRNSDLEHPDRLIVDLDPDEELAWPVVTDAARSIRKRLQSIGLESFVKTTGGKGLHLVAPLKPELDWSKFKEIARTFVVEMERERPDLYLTKMTKAARKGKIYLDYLRNERGATAVAAYSPRARAGLPVSIPLAWSELNSGERPRFTVSDFGSWQHRLKTDPWRAMDKTNQRLDL